METSILLSSWIRQLKKERIEYLENMYKTFIELNDLEFEIYYQTREAIKTASFSNANDNYDEYVKLVNKEYENAYNELLKKGITYDKEHFITKRNNGTNYTVEYKGKLLHSYYKFKNSNGYHESLFSIVKYYFYQYETKSLYNLMTRFDNKEDEYLAIENYANKEIDSYIEKLVARVERNYGKILKVKDSILSKSNVEHVIFECEKGNCYLEMIMAGGYNIQRLHNRLLVKKL